MVIIQMSANQFNPTLATFSTFMFISGVGLTIFTIDAQKNLPLSCVNSTVQNGLNSLLMLFVIMTTIPIMQLFCHWGCDCPQNDLPYSWIAGIILLFMIAGTSAVIKGSGGPSRVTCGDSARNYAISILSFSLILLIVTITVKLELWKTSSKKSKGIELALLNNF